MRIILVLTLFLFGVAAGAAPSVEGASVYFISPEDGETVASPVTVVMGLAGMGIAPAGVEANNTGHHHLIVDAPLPDLSRSVPNDDNHRHFGGGQTQTRIELAPGVHSLQLLLADFVHIPHVPPLFSEVITITVK